MKTTQRIISGSSGENNADDGNLNDSVVFVDEYIDLEAGDRGISLNIKQPPQEQFHEVEEENAIAAPAIAEIEQPKEEQPKNSADEVDEKPVIGYDILMPIAFKEEEVDSAQNIGAGGIESSMEQCMYKNKLLLSCTFHSNVNFNVFMFYFKL